jgi:hypothetical protein
MHASVCDYIADLVQNSIEAGATQIGLTLETLEEQLKVCVKDNGKGMDAAKLKQAQDPFFSEPGKHRRRVGLGLPLLYQAAESTGGMVNIESAPGCGTTVKFSFNLNHPDTPPLGSFALTLTSLMSFDGEYNLTVKRTTSEGSYEISRYELIDALGTLTEAGNIMLMRKFISSQEESL